jgi:hypothetical protein
MKYDLVNKQKLKRIGLKLNPEMCDMLRERLANTKEGRGVNLMFEGDVEFRLWVIETPEYGKELSYTFYHNLGGELKELGWKPEIVYHGEHLFWIEGFQDIDNSERKSD